MSYFLINQQAMFCFYYNNRLTLVIFTVLLYLSNYFVEYNFIMTIKINKVFVNQNDPLPESQLETHFQSLEWVKDNRTKLNVVSLR